MANVQTHEREKTCLVLYSAEFGGALLISIIEPITNTLVLWCITLILILKEASATWTPIMFSAAILRMTDATKASQILLDSLCPMCLYTPPNIAKQLIKDMVYFYTWRIDLYILLW